eukprot:362082-Chlamydomonas_euryale.AAC.3
MEEGRNKGGGLAGAAAAMADRKARSFSAVVSGLPLLRHPVLQFMQRRRPATMWHAQMHF